MRRSLPIEPSAFSGWHFFFCRFCVQLFALSTFFFIRNTLKLFGPFDVPTLALDLGHCTLFLILMRYNVLKRILLGTLGVEYSS
jgi:hypothetical protein